LLFDVIKATRLMILKYKDFKTLTKREMKDLKGGAAAGGTCGNVLTASDGQRCVRGGIPRAVAIQNSANYNLGLGEYAEGGSGGYGSVTDVNWCCASCGNFPNCDDVLDA
jgi:natural product precursor